MRLIGIVAMTENRCIGHKNTLPWHIPRDIQHFKATTMGHPVIMGRTTYESIPTKLVGRREIILSTQYVAERRFIDGLEVYSNYHDILKKLNSENIDKAYVIGGSQVYRHLLPHIDEFIITLIHTTINGDTYFPLLKDNQFKLVSTKKHRKSKQNIFPISYLHYKRV